MISIETRDGRIIGRDRTGAVLAVIHTSHLTDQQRADLASIYRAFAATLEPRGDQ